MADFKTIAGQVEQTLEKIMEVEPTIASVVGIFVPGIGMIQPEVLALAPIVEKALKAVAAGDNVSVVDAAATVAKHLLPGLPNSSILSVPSAAPDASQAGGA